VRGGLEAFVPCPRAFRDQSQRADELIRTALLSVSVGATGIAPWDAQSRPTGQARNVPKMIRQY
jgi:hypothetical protein